MCGFGCICKKLNVINFNDFCFIGENEDIENTNENQNSAVDANNQQQNEEKDLREEVEENDKNNFEEKKEKSIEEKEKEILEYWEFLLKRRGPSQFNSHFIQLNVNNNNDNDDKLQIQMLGIFLY